MIRHKFAEMATKIETARQMVYTTAWRFQNGEYPVREITMAKLYSARIAVEVADECIQIHGGNGYMQEYGIERSFSARPAALEPDSAPAHRLVDHARRGSGARTGSGPGRPARADPGGPAETAGPADPAGHRRDGRPPEPPPAQISKRC